MKNSFFAFLITLISVAIMVALPILIAIMVVVGCVALIWFIAKLILDDLDGYEK